MTDRSLSPAWLASWTSRVSETLQAITDEFEHRHGYPAGTNEVRPADRADQVVARTLAQVHVVPADLVTFYDSVGDLTWEDVGNGHFVDSAAAVHARFRQYGTVDVTTDPPVTGLVFGSNGGGLSYVANHDGVIYRTRTASLDEPELDRVADDLGQFLELLEQSLTRFAGGGDPACL
ncbi:SMI1/KNR4 family protein [Streptomyces sp. NPDC052492]|uniref:SMI1/KNR4 family protein n=1 Tax=unclassified Streptomyces TaxID=2593676 RepID=UPI0037D708B9